MTAPPAPKAGVRFVHAQRGYPCVVRSFTPQRVRYQALDPSRPGGTFHPRAWPKKYGGPA